MKEITIGDIQSRISHSYLIIPNRQLTKKLEELYPTISITKSLTPKDNEISIEEYGYSYVKYICAELDENNYDPSLLLDIPVIRILAANEEEIIVEIE